MHANSERLDRDVATTHGSCRRHSALRRRRPGRHASAALPRRGFGTVENWSRVIRRHDGKYQTVRFDARARGKSGRSADYSVQAAVDDIGRVIDATGIERPILVGWSHGATIAVRYAAQHPGRVGGLVLIDDAYPIAMLD